MTLVRLLDACLSAAASLPDDDSRQRSVDSIVAAFCRSALREAHCRAAAPPAPTSSTDEMQQVPGTGMDRVFLDASFALLAALLARHRASLGNEQLRLLHTAWGVPTAVTHGAASPPQPSSGGESLTGSRPSEAGTGMGQQQARLGTASLSSGLAGADFKCMVAVGQLLFGRTSQIQHMDCGGSGSGGVLKDASGGQQRRRVLLQTMAGTPAALDLCAAAAVADTFPGLAAADEAGLEQLTCWLQCGYQHGGAPVCIAPLGPEPWHDDCRAPAALLAEALRQHPAEVVSAVHAPLLAIAAAHAPQLLQTLLHVVASLLHQQQHAVTAMHDGWAEGDEEEGDIDGWGACSSLVATCAPEREAGPLRGQLRELHLALHSLGLDMGLLLQQHMAMGGSTAVSGSWQA